MNIPYFTRQLKDNAERINVLVRGVSIEEARWKPDRDSWSILEVVNHLYDEEREDFRVRLDIILHHPNREWPPIDPEGWVTEQKYNARDLDESLENFQHERKVSLEWLVSLGDVNWDEIYRASFGPMRGGDMFTSWVTHDHFHMRQLVELHRALTLAQAKPYSVDYAGAW